ncbi:MAG: RNA methyltransferase [Candidatus Riflebacteria bacterium]|nr:RNA methyltransferase [Candidatus Riflebacteria bacterium]
MKKITSKSNLLYREIHHLVSKGHPGSLRTGFLIEGEKLIREALHAQADIKSLFILEGYEEHWMEFESRIIVLSEPLMKSLSRLTTPPRAIAMASLRTEWSLADCLGHGRTFLVMDRLQDPGNIGSIIRTAEGLGADAVFLTRGSCSASNDKVLRAAMGSLFRLPVFDDFTVEDLMHIFHDAKIQRIGTTMSGDSIWKEKFSERAVFFLGNEGSGLEMAILQQCDRIVSIPMTGRNESLNVAVSAAVCLYERLRQIGMPR